jgi:hypothetical protein
LDTLAGVTETALLAERPASVGASLLQQVAASATKEAFRYLEGERWVSLTSATRRWASSSARAGVLVVGHQVEYPRPITFAGRALEIYLPMSPANCGRSRTYGAVVYQAAF